ncbi:DMT family transporter [Loktanella sp. IMCC34160]|uniref:DMT family transporter n=1 Tax=Loktanella sp. IMCC34160 TaxID=2510646 RepID=UPI00101D34C7|nr:DMT family transporter [Loktanella sp. IMCC34160]RYG90379.1 DMT family transporter [Loktanella sp. IMCC34160]
MFRSISDNPTLMGALCALVAVFCFSINDMAIKFLSGGYALHQVVLFRSLIGMVVLLTILLPLSGGLAALRTRRLGMHLLRGACVVFANMTFFLGLAALPLAEGVAIFFVSPLIITVFSVIFLKETVGPLRWAAIALGLVGILIVLRPGTEVFQPAALLPVAAAFGYATLHMLTRYIGRTESALAMSFYIQLTFILISSGMGVAFGKGQFAGWDNASLDFMFREWVMPHGRDWLILVTVGAASAFGGFFISQAYRVAEAAVVAPFEYVAMPLAVFWGVLVFAEWPDGVAIAGIALIIGSGLFMVWREAKSRRAKVPDTPRYRR